MGFFVFYIPLQLMQLDYNYSGSKPQLALSLMTGTRVAGDIDSGAGPEPVKQTARRSCNLGPGNSPCVPRRADFIWGARPIIRSPCNCLKELIGCDSPTFPISTHCGQYRPPQRGHFQHGGIKQSDTASVKTEGVQLSPPPYIVRRVFQPHNIYMVHMLTACLSRPG